MTGPEEPGDDWAFPEVADPSSVQLPVEPSEQVYDTHSDAWWRQQAEAQRRAAESEPAVPPAPAFDPPPVEPVPVIEPTVLATPSPLDRDWLPPDLSSAAPTETVAPPEPVYEEPVPVVEEPVHEEAARPTERLRPAVDDLPPAMHVPLTRPPHQGDRVGPGRAVAGALLAVGGVALGIGALLVYGHKEPKGNGAVIEVPTSVRPTATTVPSAEPTPTSAQPSPTAVVLPASPVQAAKAPVDVLNNSKIKGLADRAAATFRAGGWTVPVTGNYRGGTIAQTTIYFAPGQQASAERFARQFGTPRVLPRFTGLPGSGLTVVVTRDFR